MRTQEPHPPDRALSPSRHAVDRTGQAQTATGRRRARISSRRSPPTGSLRCQLASPGLRGIAGRVSDYGEGRWTIKAAINEGVPVPVLSASLFARLSSRGEAVYADELLSAMRMAFGGHVERARASSRGS